MAVLQQECAKTSRSSFLGYNICFRKYALLLFISSRHILKTYFIQHSISFMLFSRNRNHKQIPQNEMRIITLRSISFNELSMKAATFWPLVCELAAICEPAWTAICFTAGWISGLGNLSRVGPGARVTVDELRLLCPPFLPTIEPAAA